MSPTPPSNASSRDGYVALLGVVVLALAVGLAVKGVKIDDSILILIGIGALLACWPALSARLSKFSIGKDGITVELSDRVAAVEAKAASTQTTVSTLSRATTRPARISLASLGERFNLTAAISDGESGSGSEPPSDTADTPVEDPLAGKFGDLAARNGRALTAQVRPHPAVPEWGVIDLRVDPTPGAPPITDPVTFHLHPSFAPNDIQTISPGSSGAVSLEVTAYGAFTVGVDTDAGRTELELDLATAPGAFSPWKDR